MCPLDPTIPLRAEAPNIYEAAQKGRADAMANQTAQMQNSINAQKLEYLPQQLQTENAKSQLDLQGTKLAQAKAHTQLVGQIIGSATDQATYDAAKAQAQKLGIDVSDEPPVFDPAHIKSIQMGALDAAQKIELAQKSLDNQREAEKFGETKRHNLADEATNAKKADSPFGNSFQGRAYSTLLNGDPNSPEYALAVNAATQPKMQPITNADGTTSLVAVTPQLPDIIKNRGAPNPASTPGAALTPPVVNGAADTTPTTQGQLLAPPSAAGRSYAVEPIAGTTGAAKLTDDQTKAAGFAQRMENSNGVLNGLSGNGYTPSVATDDLGNSKVGNAMLTDQGQQFVQAKRDFVNAVLRRESGAAISQGEFDNADKQYFPQPNDKPGAIANKAKLREAVIQNMKLSAGGAMNRMDQMKSGQGAHPVLQTPQAAQIKAQVQSGQITPEQGIQAIKALAQ